MTTCRTCGRSFRPSSGHRDCPACRSRDRCACGDPKQKKSRSCLACRPKGGEDGGTWRGGRIRHKAGYVMRWIPDHPHARSNPYVFEHILVMEAQLGRPLHPDETVHHRNGIKDDNRPENLETLDETSTDRDPGPRRDRMGARDRRPLRRRPLEILILPASQVFVEVKGIEPLCSGDRQGLLRAQPMRRSRPGAIHRQRASGPARMRCPPPASEPNRRGQPAQVIPDPRPQAHGAGSDLTSVRQRARTRRWRLCWSGVFRDIRDHGPLLPDGETSESKPVHPL